MFNVTNQRRGVATTTGGGGGKASTGQKRTFPYSTSSTSSSSTSSSYNSSKKKFTRSPPSKPPPPELDLLSTKQREAYDLALDGHNLFLTGCGGTGKSFLIEQLYRGLCHRHGTEGIALTATTGIAAVNIGGVTLHHFTGIRLGDTLEDFGCAWSKKDDWRTTKVCVFNLLSFFLSFFLSSSSSSPPPSSCTYTCSCSSSSSSFFSHPSSFSLYKRF
jgi:hypothetical protein